MATDVVWRMIPYPDPFIRALRIRTINGPMMLDACFPRVQNLAYPRDDRNRSAIIGMFRLNHTFRNQHTRASYGRNRRHLHFRRRW